MRGARRQYGGGCQNAKKARCRRRASHISYYVIGRRFVPPNVEVPGVEIAIVDVADDAAMEAFRGLLVEYEASLDEDLRISDLEGELLALARRYADGALMLARAGGKAVGCVVVNPVDGKSVEIKRLYVVPESRGTGLGRALMEAAIAYARERSFARIVLDTERDRLAQAYALYRSLGFVHCEAYAPVDYESPTYMELEL